MQIKRYMSLGSNCTVAGALRELELREKGIFDWALVKDFHSVVKLFSNIPNLYSFNNELNIQFPHQDITNINVYKELCKRLHNTLEVDKNTTLVYLVEHNSGFDFIYNEIKEFRKYKSNRLILILPIEYSIEQYNKLKELNVYCYYDKNCIFDASGNFNAKCKDYANEMKKVLGVFNRELERYSEPFHDDKLRLKV